ncbi:amidase [Nisaea acidiphila]|uniref:Amidase n=1 Tax=Nisaea acidiphila TaxID=1862145 RepID=A0A9J7AYY9_9PROT|nr:amidase [Nisaea acidiphila]UUX51649.1 amidase [Nisaea acidiphila]
MARIPDDPFEAGGIAAFAEDLRAGRTSSEAVTLACLERIDALDGKIGAFQHVAPETALQTAQAMDGLLRAGTDLGPLMGVPFGVKDIYAVDGMPTTNGSLIESAEITGSEGTYVQRLKKAGAVILGKTKTVEFALGATGQNEARGTPWNPWDLETQRIPGGSSSGSAAATAAGMCAFALGSDTGGSIRIPAALCGLFGLKTSIGLIPTDGVFPLSPTLDTVGPLCRSATDAAIVHAVTMETPVPDTVSPGSLRLGLLRDFFFEDLDPEVEKCMDLALRALSEAGVTIVELNSGDLPDPKERETIFPPIVGTEILASLGVDRFMAGRGGMDSVTAARASVGLDVSGVDYALALRRHETLKRLADEAVKPFDGLISPATPMVALPAESLKDKEGGARGMAASRNTQPGNLWGMCGISVPIQQFGSDLPVGLQVLCRRGMDAHALSIGRAIEEIVGRPRMPRISGTG